MATRSSRRVAAPRDALLRPPDSPRCPLQTETRIREGDAPVTCKRVLRWVRCFRHVPRPRLALTAAREQIASDPVWTGQSDDMQVLMSRTVNVDEEELLLATNDRATKMIKSTVKVLAAAAASTPRRRSSLARPCRRRALPLPMQSQP